MTRALSTPCERHEWTIIPEDIRGAGARLRMGQPTWYAGPTLPAHCAKCGVMQSDLPEPPSTRRCRLFGHKMTEPGILGPDPRHLALCARCGYEER